MTASARDAADPATGEPGRLSVPALDRRCIFIAVCMLGIHLLGSVRVQAAYTEPRLALTRATPVRSASGRVTVKIEGTFSFADAVQLALPVSVTVSQGSLQARFDLDGNVFTSISGGPEQPTPGPGLVSVGEREITVVLPPAFTAGQATVRVILSYQDRPIASNSLSISL